MVWAVIAIVGMQFLGIDIKEIVAMLSDMQQQAETIQVKSHGLCSGDIALPALVGIYAWGRTAYSGGIRPPIPLQSGPPVPEQSGPGIPL